MSVNHLLIVHLHSECLGCRLHSSYRTSTGDDESILGLEDTTTCNNMELHNMLILLGTGSLSNFLLWFSCCHNQLLISPPKKYMKHTRARNDTVSDSKSRHN